MVDRPATAGSGGDLATEPIDYAVLNAAYAALLTAVVVATRSPAGEREPIAVRELLPLSAATFALSKVIAREKIGSWLREPFVDESAGTRRPRGRRMRHVIGELVTCTRCVGAWSALGVVGLRLVDPQAGRAVTAVLACSGVNDVLQPAFRWLCDQSNLASRDARGDQRRANNRHG